LTATTAQPTTQPKSSPDPATASINLPQKDLDSLKNQISALQAMMAKQMQMQQQQSTRPGQS
jgi:hypothetical protein